VTSEPAPNDPGPDQHLAEEIAQQVIGALRTELEAILAELAAGAGDTGGRPLTVEQLAQRYGVARSTVYAHWREWGGYKLGQGQKAAIRFPPQTIPNRGSPPTASQNGAQTPSKGARRRPSIRGRPRLPQTLGDDMLA
jgi:transposase-like protein